MDVSQWAEIRRLHEVEKLSQREIARRVRCHRDTVRRALAQAEPTAASSRSSFLDPYKSKIDQLVKEFPELSAVRIFEEIRQGDDGYRGSVILVRRYVRTIRPAKGRVYQEVQHDPGQAMQVDWGDCDTLRIENTTRKVSVFVAVLCYSRMIYIEFALGFDGACVNGFPEFVRGAFGDDGDGRFCEFGFFFAAAGGEEEYETKQG